MAARVLDGKALAQRVLDALVPRVARLRAEGVHVCVSIVRVGDDPASKVYVRGKMHAGEQIGVSALVIELPASTTREEVCERLAELNCDPAVHGILVQLPLPEGFDPHAIAAEIDPGKDVDGFHAANLGRLVQGTAMLPPCTPAGVLRLLDDAGIDLRRKHCVVVGRSETVGKPMALMLIERDATVTVCHSKTRDLPAYTRDADVLVVATGRPGLIDGSMVRAGAAVIDVGVNRAADGRLVGDVDALSVAGRAGYLSPVPGGVGPMTVAMLMENTVRAAELRFPGLSQDLTSNTCSG
jgi:methylenetetrahydrofolate dehydrogenase (NADP+)/methenyltetrahydrofolate cyclohydrolase